MANPPITAVFDFDGTLYRGDSFIKFALFCFGKKKFTAALIKTLPWLVAWKIGIVSNSRAKQKLFAAMFAGMPLNLFEKRGCEFAREIEKRLIPETIGKLADFNSCGAHSVILTASMPAWIRPWAHNHGIKDVIGTEPEVSNGILTGRFSTPNCYGAEKMRRLLKAFTDISQTEIHAFSDSDSDLPLLNFATHAYKI